MTSHAFDCPEQNHTSPKVTSAIVAAVVLAHPAHAALIEKLPPAACGGRTAFHEA